MGNNCYGPRSPASAPAEAAAAGGASAKQALPAAQNAAAQPAPAAAPAPPRAWKPESRGEEDWGDVDDASGHLASGVGGGVGVASSGGGGGGGDEEDAIESVQDVNLEDMQQRQLRRAFDFYDKDKNGVLDRQELEEMIKSLYQPTKAEITMFVKRFDKNNDGKISFKEFRSGIQKMNPRYRMPENEPFIAALFKRFDVNNDGHLTGDELIEVARYTLRVPENMKQRVLDKFDDNRDGYISFAEFAKHMQELQGDLSEMWQLKRQTSLVRVASNLASHFPNE